MAAETLGIDYSLIRAQGRYESTGFCNTTGGSRTTFATGMAVTQACEDVIRECKKRAALTWGSMRIWSSGKTPRYPRSGVNADVEALSLAELAGKAGKQEAR